MPAGIGTAQDAQSLKVLIVTDAWTPQVNGVVRTLEILGRDLRALGHEVRYATPEGRFTVPMPTYPEIRLSILPRKSLEREIREYAPDAIHIATEGTLGLAARAICRKYGIPFTTSFHTRFPEYVHARFRFISEARVYRFLRWFHAPATAMMGKPRITNWFQTLGSTTARPTGRPLNPQARSIANEVPIPTAAPPGATEESAVDASVTRVAWK